MIDELVFFGEVDSLEDAHFIGQALESAGVEYKVAEHQSHGFDVAIPHGWGMLYVDPQRFDEVRGIVDQVRDDEDALADAAEEAAEAAADAAEGEADEPE